jgi:hypothetical protein
MEIHLAILEVFARWRSERFHTKLDRSVQRRASEQLGSFRDHLHRSQAADPAVDQFDLDTCMQFALQTGFH